LLQHVTCQAKMFGALGQIKRTVLAALGQRCS